MRRALSARRPVGTVPPDPTGKDPSMTATTYLKGGTALHFIDPYNDFLAGVGKMRPMVSEVARSVDLHANLARVRAPVRAVGIPIFILPHHRHKPTDFEGWSHPTPFSWARTRPNSSTTRAGAASGIRTSPQSPAISSSRSTGAGRASPIPISTCNCASTGSPMSS